MKHTCHYHRFCSFSSTKIYELVDKVLQNRRKTEQGQRVELVKELEQWAMSHIDLKAAISSAEGLIDHCADDIERHRKELESIRSALLGNQDVDRIEDLLFDWYVNVFLSSEKACQTCKYNEQNQ